MPDSAESDARTPVLFLSQCLPYPPFSGVTRRTYNIIRQLALDFDVTLLAFYRKNHQRTSPQLREARIALGDVAEVLEPVPISSEKSLGHFLWNHARSLASQRPYTYYEYGGERFRTALENAIASSRPALVHMDSLDLFRWLDLLPDVPVTCTHHSIESELLRLRAEKLANPISAAYVKWQSRRVESVERRYAPQVTVNLMMSSLDAYRLDSIAPGSRTVVIPNGVDTDEFSVGSRSASHAESNEVLFLGPLYMYPNWDGIRAFVRDSWPVIRRRVPDATLTLIGRASPAKKAELQADGVRVCGFVDDVKPYMERAACCIAPLRVGGGTRLKILEYWAMARPVVSTSIGCEGLNTQDGDNILIREDPTSFAEAIIGILNDTEFARRLGLNGRATVESTYSWDRIGRDLRRLYGRLIEASGDQGHWDARASEYSDISDG